LVRATTRIRFAHELKLHAIETWDNILTHRFVNEISMDVLPLDKFVFYLKQDHIFLKEFCNFLQTAKQKSEETKIKEWFDSLFDSTVNSEMEMQKKLLHSLGTWGDVNLSNTKPSKTTRDYSSYLRKISLKGNLGEIVSAMAPCPWSYFEIAKKLSKNHIQTDVYRKWVEFYSSYESFRQVEKIKENLNLLGKKAREKDKIVMKNRFNTSCKYEYAFWEMAYSLGKNR
jgi:thiaminase (transcriptional activator TenA)